MRFRTFWPCDGNGSMCAPRILAEGEIETGTAQRFAEFLAHPAAHEIQLPPTPTVVFDSPGGSVGGGMELGRAIRARRMDTEAAEDYSHVVIEGPDHRYPSLVNAPMCASACVLAFVMLDAASLVPSSSMRWVTQKEAQRVSIDNTRPALSPWTVTPLAGGNAALEVTQQIAQGRKVNLRVLVKGDVVFVLATTLLESGSYAADRVQQFPVGQPAEIAMCAGQHCISGAPIKSWSRSDGSTLIGMASVSAFGLRDFRDLTRRGRLSINDGFPRALSDVTLATDLSTDGLVSGLSLLARIK